MGFGRKDSDMADMYGQIQERSVGRGADGSHAMQRMLSGGEAIVEERLLALGIEGKLFGAHFGTVTTPLVTAATTAIVATSPQAWIRVPDGTLIIPLSAELVVEATGITTQGEISIATAKNDVGNGTSAAGTSGPINLNTAETGVGNCTARQLATAAVTAETSLLELKRFSFAVSAVNQEFAWRAANNRVYPILRGPASWLIYIGGNAVNFFAQLVWAELPE